MFLKYNRFDFSNFPWYFVILLLLHSSMASGEKAETKLRNLLLKDYVPELLPETNANGSVDVLITTFVRTMEPQLQNFVNLKAVLLFQWNDSRLRYEDQNPENIKKLSLQGDEIWVPDLTVYNMHTSQKLLDHSTRCSVNPTGLLRCSQKVSLYLYCELNYTDWPHDTQLCSLHIGTWIEEKVHLKPWLKSDGIIMTAGKKTPKWILKEIIYIPEEVSGPVTSMEYSFKIQRVDKGHFAQFIVPANVVATLSLCAFWMPRDKGMVRVGFSLAVLMLNALFIQDLGFIFWLSGGDFLPKICKYFANFLIW
ncbi:acetylcholine receptor subunit alpha-like [Cloeon dipterum]|uniref:acetylcholine receptor subunit alpha-like n=1 Tax=Cloeon dipterum TaxID=197152 RepID=UPI00322048CF